MPAAICEAVTVHVPTLTSVTTPAGVTVHTLVVLEPYVTTPDDGDVEASCTVPEPKTFSGTGVMTRDGIAAFTVIAFVAELLALNPSFVAPVVALTVADPAAVGVPETGHEIVPPKVTDAAGLAGVHAPSVSPAGTPALQVAVVAATVPGAAFVQTTVPL